MHSTRCPEAQYWSKWELLRLLVQSLCRLHAFPQSSLWHNRSAATASRGHTPKLSLPHPTPWPSSVHSPLNPPSSSPWLQYHSFGHGQCKSRCETLTAQVSFLSKITRPHRNRGSVPSGHATRNTFDHQLLAQSGVPTSPFSRFVCFLSPLYRSTSVLCPLTFTRTMFLKMWWWWVDA